MTKKKIKASVPENEVTDVTMEPIAADSDVVEPNAVPQISLDDLNKAATFIALAIKRGVYEANEVRQVGEVFESLTNFLQHQIDLANKANKESE